MSLLRLNMLGRFEARLLSGEALLLPTRKAERTNGVRAKSGTDTAKTKEIIEELETLHNTGTKIGDGVKEIAQMKAVAASYGYRNTWPSVLAMFADSIESVASDNGRYKQCAKNRAEATLLAQEGA